MSFETLAPIIFLMALREKVSPILYGNFVFKKKFLPCSSGVLHFAQADRRHVQSLEYFFKKKGFNGNPWDRERVIKFPDLGLDAHLCQVSPDLLVSDHLDGPEGLVHVAHRQVETENYSKKTVIFDFCQTMCFGWFYQKLTTASLVAESLASRPSKSFMRTVLTAELDGEEEEDP